MSEENTLESVLGDNDYALGKKLVQTRVSELEERAKWFIPGHLKRKELEQEIERLKEALANG